MIVSGFWLSTQDGDPAAYELFSRHYSAHKYRDNRRLVGRNRNLFVGPGEKMVLVSEQYNALFVWRKFISDDGQQGINCAVFRNESGMVASDLIREAETLAWNRWPGERLYTYVNPRKIRSVNPGYCFKRAGWRVCGESKGGLIILEKRPAEGG